MSYNPIQPEYTAGFPGDSLGLLDLYDRVAIMLREVLGVAPLHLRHVWGRNAPKQLPGEWPNVAIFPDGTTSEAFTAGNVGGGHPGGKRRWIHTMRWFCFHGTTDQPYGDLLTASAPWPRAFEMAVAANTTLDGAVRWLRLTHHRWGAWEYGWSDQAERPFSYFGWQFTVQTELLYTMEHG